MDSYELNSIVNEDLYCSSTQEIDNASNVIKHVVQELPNFEDFEGSSNEGKECDGDDEYLPPSGDPKENKQDDDNFPPNKDFQGTNDDCPQSEDFYGTNDDFIENGCTNNDDGFLHRKDSNRMNDDFL